MVPEALRASRKAPLSARSVMVVVDMVEVPVKVLVPFIRRFCTVRRVPSKARLLESISRPPVVRNGTRPVVRPEIAKLVVVALVVVELVPLAFAKRSVPVKVGEADNTKLPVPVTPVTSVIRESSSAIVSSEEDEILPLKVVQSVAVRRPRAEADEFGMFNVTVPPSVDEALLKLRSVPVLVVANESHGVARPALVKVPVILGV